MRGSSTTTLSMVCGCGEGMRELWASVLFKSRVVGKKEKQKTRLRNIKIMFLVFLNADKQFANSMKNTRIQIKTLLLEISLISHSAVLLFIFSIYFSEILLLNVQNFPLSIGKLFCHAI